jgi:MFS family permease
MLPATIVIPVLRSFVELHWPAQEWVMHAFVAVNLLGAVALGPVIAVRAERWAKRRLISTLAIGFDGALLLGVSWAPALIPLLVIRFIQGGAYIAGVSILMGSVRRKSHPGVVGSAAILAILVGIPLGAVAGKSNPAWPLYLGGLCGLLTSVVSYFALSERTDEERSDVGFTQLLSSKTLLVPSVLVGLERLAVGAFVVTLQLYGHYVLRVSSQQVSTWFSIFLATFAMTTFPFSRWAQRRGPKAILVLGSALYAATFIALPFASSTLLSPLFFVGGVASGAIYGPCLGLATEAVKPSARASAMAFLNAAGTLGMFFGSSFAGLLSRILLELGYERQTAYGAVFVGVGVLQLLSVAMASRVHQPTPGE